MSPNRLSNLTIVVVDDNDDVTKVFGSLLGSLGCKRRGGERMRLKA